MLRQIQRLTRRVPAAGPSAQAIAIYAQTSSEDGVTRTRAQPADGREFEGVACVDDAARGAVLYCKLSARSFDGPALAGARALLQFVGYLQEEDGRVANFITDWEGGKNLTGTTSFPGGVQWQARALHAFAWGVTAFPGGEWEERFDRCLPWVESPMPYMDVRAVCVLAALTHWQATGSPRSAELSLAWAEEIAMVRDGDCLLNAAGVQPIHLWGHLQEAALAETGRLLGRPDLVETARAGAEALLLPAAAHLATARDVLPFDVSCVVSGLTAVARAADSGRYRVAAARALSWFSGNNAAGEPVYDRNRGLVYDGIDGARVSCNSGAESNIEGALAVLRLCP